MKRMYPILVITWILFCSCSKTAHNDSSLKNDYNNEVQNDIDGIEEPVEISDDIWKNAYYQYLVKVDEFGYNFFHNIEIDGFAVAYINDDDIPELITHGISHAEGDKVLSYVNGKVVELSVGNYPTYIDRNNLLYSEIGGQGYFTVEVFSIIEGSWNRVFSGSYNDWGNYPGELTYYIDDKNVSKELYESSLEKVFNSNKANEPDFSMDAFDLIVYLTGDEELAKEEVSKTVLNININGIGQAVVWEYNESVNALKELAKNGLIINTTNYGGFEQVGSIGSSIPSNDKQITATTGDIMLYNGNQIVVCFGENTSEYTRLGKLTYPDEIIIDSLAVESAEILITITE